MEGKECQASRKSLKIRKWKLYSIKSQTQEELAKLLNVD